MESQDLRTCAVIYAFMLLQVCIMLRLCHYHLQILILQPSVTQTNSPALGVNSRIFQFSEQRPRTSFTLTACKQLLTTDWTALSDPTSPYSSPNTIHSHWDNVCRDTQGIHTLIPLSALGVLGATITSCFLRAQRPFLHLLEASWMRERLWMLFTLTSERLLTLFPTAFSWWNWLLKACMGTHFAG